MEQLLDFGRSLARDQPQALKAMDVQRLTPAFGVLRPEPDAYGSRRGRLHLHFGNSVRRGLGCRRGIVDWNPQRGASVVGHEVVVLQVVTDKDFHVLLHVPALFNLGLHVQLGVRGGLALFVQRFVDGVLRLKPRDLLGAQPPISGVFLGK